MDEEEKIRLLTNKLRPEITREELRRLITGLNLVGKVKGVIGPWVIRYNRSGTMIISRRPEEFHPSASKKAVRRRGNFAAVVKFALFLNNIDVVQRIWAKDKLEGNCAYNRIIKYNSNNFEDCHPTIKNIILPEKTDFSFNASISAEAGRINFKHIQTENNFDSMLMILIPYDPVAEDSEKFEMISLTGCSSADNDINLSNEQMEICKRYRRYILFTALVKKNEDSCIWSNTLINEGDIKVLLTINDDHHNIRVPFIVLLNNDHLWITPVILTGQKDDYRRALFKGYRLIKIF